MNHGDYDRGVDDAPEFAGFTSVEKRKKVMMTNKNGYAELPKLAAHGLNSGRTPSDGPNYGNTPKSAPDLVAHPPHYCKPGVMECIDIIEMLGWQNDAYLFNTFKYMYRFKEKGGVESLKKAIWYFQRKVDGWTNEDLFYSKDAK